MKTDAPNTRWTSIACSADGSRLIAVSDIGDDLSPGSIFTSTNFGLTWLSNTVFVANGCSAACSADGMNLFATDQLNFFSSTNGGSTWAVTQPEPNMNLSSICASADGRNLVLGADRSVSTGYNSTNQLVVYVSKDSGVSWTLSLTNAQWDDGTSYSFISDVASSSDGSTLFAVTQSGAMFSGSMFVSTNCGNNWTTNSVSSALPLSMFSGVACSADGRTVVACRGHELAGIYVSTNAGLSWTRTDMMTGMHCAASSADGTKLAAADWSGFIYTSTDAGAVWSRQNPEGWSSCAGIASSADGCKLAAVMNGGGIYTWQNSPTPVLNITCRDTNLLLSWIVPSMDFGLQESADLTNWAGMEVTPVLNYTNLRYEASLTTPTGPRFYRLAMRQ